MTETLAVWGTAAQKSPAVGRRAAPRLLRRVCLSESWNKRCGASRRMRGSQTVGCSSLGASP
eukprot:2190564-Pleurochrysis_carterae.AAC.1